MQIDAPKMEISNIYISEKFYCLDFFLVSQFLTPKMTLLRYPYLRLPKFASSSTIFHLSPFFVQLKILPIHIYMTESDICAFPLPFFKRHIYG